MSHSNPPLITILCPVYNEEKTIPLFFGRVRPVIETLSQRYEIHLLFLNNASTDRTSHEIDKIRGLWPNTFVIVMSRNVGYQNSLQCGLRNAVGDIFVIIDVDCEDPPEMIAQFVEKYEQGFDIVFGARVDRHEPKSIKSARKLFYRLLHRIADDEIIMDMAEFSLFTVEVRDAILDENTSFPFIRAAIGRVGFRRAAIPFTRQPRIAGTTHYNLLSMAIFAVAGILSSSTLFLRLPIYFLPFWFISLVGLTIGYALTRSLWLALAIFLVTVLYMGATLAFTALYVARSYKNGLHRPNAFIDHKHSVLQPAAKASDRTTGVGRAALRE